MWIRPKTSINRKLLGCTGKIQLSIKRYFRMIFQNTESTQIGHCAFNQANCKQTTTLAVYSKVRQSSGQRRKLRQNKGWSQVFGGSSVVCWHWYLFLLQSCHLGSLAQYPLGRVFAGSPKSNLHAQDSKRKGSHEILQFQTKSCLEGSFPN